LYLYALVRIITHNRINNRCLLFWSFKMTGKSFVPVERIEKTILLIRSQKVILDNDLAVLYEVKTRVLVQAVKRNIERFPRSQSVTSSSWGGRRYPPYAFTEQGVAMLSSVLRSQRAVQVNIEII
jgi:hypothetical protein